MREVVRELLANDLNLDVDLVDGVVGDTEGVVLLDDVTLGDNDVLAPDCSF